MAFERRVAARLLESGFTFDSQVPAAGGFADFVLRSPLQAVVEAKHTLRAGALPQAQRYAEALNITTIVLVCRRLAVSPEDLGAADILVDLAAITEHTINVVLLL